MASSKQTLSLTAVKPAGKKKPAAVKAAQKTPVEQFDQDERDLFSDNLAAMTQVIKSLTETVEALVQKAESMAYHIIATEEIIAELVAANGLNLARVNARIRAKTESSPDPVNSIRAIDVAAAIASPLPRR